ncbi:hypothetical protein VIN01S_37510 [Vibrio inusitatus NBRC 102082]|uniref:Uncharacterized protein n=1 Tax=Vibrio inusitatus NBRC 102082 TaxID=1219070 RepID=A0A4Y3I0J7_9VIBR|nr:hypothetical protein VIN01S_37510 [Vibrio inusitatus NBRC 102082]
MLRPIALRLGDSYPLILWISMLMSLGKLYFINIPITLLGVIVYCKYMQYKELCEKCVLQQDVIGVSGMFKK